MYEITCPYCGQNNITFEVDGFINLYTPHECGKCNKIYFILQRSWLDPTYDNHNVEVRKKEWFSKKRKGIEFVGNATDKVTKEKIKIYRRSDLYDKFGGEEAVKKMCIWD